MDKKAKAATKAKRSGPPPSKTVGKEPRKEWEWLGAGGELALEATSEHPIMYTALGSEPRTQHPFNLYRDIMSSPQALADTLKQIPPAVKKVADEVRRRGLKRLIGTGLGTSQFVAIGAAAALGNFAGADADSVDSGEFITSERDWDLGRSGFIVFSGSGRTFDANAAAKKAKDGGAYVVAVTSVPHSPLTAIADDVIVCAGGFDTGGSDTFHYMTRLAAGMMLGLELGERNHHRQRDFPALRQQLAGVPGWLKQNLGYLDGRCRSIARAIRKARSVIIVGGGANLATAEEFALKFEEMAHIPASAMCPDRHIHGALGLTDERIVTAVVAPPGASDFWLDQIAQATVGLKTPALAITTADERQISRQMDWVVRLPNLDETIFAIPATLPVQLIPYYCAVELGDINPDCQRSNIPKHARVWMKLFPKDSH
jgi:glutamine---fructose-6-phosphate transaminase (isomerizing)